MRIFGFDVSWLEDQQFLAAAGRQLLVALGCSPTTIASVDEWIELGRRGEEVEFELAAATSAGTAERDAAEVEAELERMQDLVRRAGARLLDDGTDILGRLDALGIRSELFGLDRQALDSYLIDVSTRLESFDARITMAAAATTADAPQEVNARAAADAHATAVDAHATADAASDVHSVAGVHATADVELPALPRDAEVAAVRPTRDEKRAIDGVLDRVPDETVRRIAPIGGRWLVRRGYRVGLFSLRRVQRRRGWLWHPPES